MGIELDGFLGRVSELREWEGELPSAIVCPFAGNLGMVPVTGALSQELCARLGPAGTYQEGVRAWGAQASRSSTIAYFSAFEFGDEGMEETIVWSHGSQVLSGSDVEAVFSYLRDQAGIDVGTTSDSVLGKHRGETAAEKWAAAAIVDGLATQPGPPIPALVNALRYERADAAVRDLVRQLAADSLRTLGPAAKEALPALERSLKTDQASGVRHAAALALGAIGPEATAALTHALRAAVYEDRWPLIQALGALGAGGKGAVSTLVGVLQGPVLHDYLGVRREAAASLGKIGSEAKAAVPALIAALRDEDWTIRSAAAAALPDIAPADSSAASALSDARTDESEWVRDAAERALARMRRQ
jgi:hypothetical protein